MNKMKPNNSDSHHLASGFTLMEAMVTLGIVAILATLATPSFMDLIKKQFSDNYAKDMQYLLQFARSAAISKKGYVSVCNYTTQGDTLKCLQNTDWSDQVIVFLDNGDRQCSNCLATPGNGDRLLKRLSAPNSSVTITTGLETIVFQPTGQTGDGNGDGQPDQGTIEIKSNQKNAAKSEIKIDLSGRVYLSS